MGKIKKLYQLSLDSQRPLSYRIFSLAEIFCILMSAITIIGLFIVVILRCLGVLIPNYITITLPFFLSGAVGYLTNFIAVKMLFEPYERSDKHWIRYITLGCWKQGMIPANKNKIGEQMAEEISTKLLTPESISREICALASTKISDPMLLNRFSAEINSIVLENENKIIEFLIPKIEGSILSTVDKVISPENIKTFWDEILVKWIQEGANKEKVSLAIVSVLKNKTPQLTKIAREFLVEKVNSWQISAIVKNNLNFDLAESLAQFINWKEVEVSLSRKLTDKKTQDQIKDEVIKTAELIRKWIDSEEAKRPINSFLITSKAYIEQFLHTYIQNEVPLMINKMLNSDELIKWFKENAMPSMQKKLTIWLESDGCKLIVENFNIRKRILEAVDKQDIKEFQDMIDNVASEHLGTIQVLGYVLGLIFGSILFFC